MNTLDNLTKIKKLDSGKVLPSIQMLGEQIKQSWQEFKKVKLPKDYQNINKVVINGMGGSGLPGHILRSVFFDQLKVPVGVINSYQLPASLDKNTLYIISSYSGMTEEPLSTFSSAKKRGARIFGITSGSILASWIKSGQLPGFIFKPKFNPSAQPRMGLGYSFGAHLALFEKLGLIKISDSQIKNCLANLSKLQTKFAIEKPTGSNLAKKLALQIQNKIPVVVAAEFLSGNAHVLANQFNESAKNFSVYFLISELNHHLLEALSFPRTNSKNLFFLLFDSKFYYYKNRTRTKITQHIVTKNKIKSFIYPLTTNDKLSQSFEMLLFGSYLSFYLAILNNVNPAKIPWVDYFKKELKKSN